MGWWVVTFTSYTMKIEIQLWKYKKVEFGFVNLIQFIFRLSMKMNDSGMWLVFLEIFIHTISPISLPSLENDEIFDITLDTLVVLVVLSISNITPRVYICLRNNLDGGWISSPRAALFAVKSSWSRFFAIELLFDYSKWSTAGETDRNIGGEV